MGRRVIADPLLDLSGEFDPMNVVNPFGFGVVPSYDFITAFTGEGFVGTRNDFDGEVGFRFTASANMEPTHLARWRVSGTGTHVVRIYSEGGIALYSASVVLSAGSVGGFVFAPATKLTGLSLVNGGIYYCMSEESVGSDLWYDVNSFVASTSDGALSGSAYRIPASSITNFSSLTYGPLSFRYTK
jgi:hypothetical protein